MNYVRSRKPWGWSLVLVLVILLLVLLWYLLGGFRKPAPGPIFTVDCDPLDEPEAFVAPEGAPTDRFLVQRQVIIIGPRGGVDEVVQEVAAQDIPLSPIRSCDLNFVGRLPDFQDIDPAYFPFPSETLDQLVMRLYQAPQERPVGEVVETVNTAGLERFVFADPNYLIGLLGQSACGNPYSVAGSPYSVAGSPYSVAGSPYSVAGSPFSVTLTPAQMFWEQWAFKQIGVGPRLTEVLRATQLDPTGAGVRVGVFDTSPFTPTRDASLTTVSGELRRPESVAWVTPTLSLTTAYPTMTVLTASVPPTTPDVRDHGLYVAGLVHAVAPESDIRLTRILNEYGCGSLFTLNEALYRFVAEVETDLSTLEGAVINLSLGVHKPVGMDEAEPPPPERQVQGGGVAQTDDVALQEAEEPPELLAEDTIESLQAAVFLAHSRGVVVVAAAGNDSYLEDKPLPPQLPAAYPFVVGVGGSNVMRQRSCFSNWGDVSAPGGDGGLDEKSWRRCMPQADQCSGDCDAALISLALSSPTGYAYWSGSSFSAPLVSGLAALVLEAGASGADQVFDAIRCGAPTPDGVINVPATVFRCIP
jgi:hypothetical protein